MTSKTPTVFGFGINDSDTPTSKGKNGCPYYSRWAKMIERCYSPKIHIKNPRYKDCKVCEEWLTFSNFKRWMIKQDWQGKHLDKDLLIQGNKIYSPNTCLFVTQEINKLINDHKAKRGEQPIGVYKQGDKFKAYCNKNGKQVYLGLHLTSEKAFQAYKAFKLNLIKEIASTQSEPLRSALLKYEVRP